MITPEYFRELARFNRWQNRGLFELCDSIGESERRRSRGMFFDSIHGTLNHLLLIDRVLLDFIESLRIPDPLPAPTTVLFEEFAALRRDRNAFDDGLLLLADDCDAAYLARTVDFFSERLQRPRSLPRGFYIAQIFQHGTHHRSQITCELHRLGLDYGSTDLPANPESLF